ncbi:glycosyltransferase [Thalassoroseus pseudoceratinae]|uniref:glycosyltransferase n=1 Tax=Thalassoroseus pseudoceratinae TaxID=2713176 RepID=UPI00142487F2|nr:glycosyltransferase family 2 protein [Thalassoroseus pseudoceratinae]
MCDLTVVVPTYQEAANLPELVSRIDQATKSAGIHAEILIVDDNSPDDTPMVCKELAVDFPIRLIVRTEERGLASAVVAGMKVARGDVLLCMDADLSHPPEAIPELYHAVSGTAPIADFVVGSRYVPGGGTDAAWGLFRWLNSKIATLLARPLTAVQDPMAGFFALRRETFEQSAPLDPIGWKIGLELIVKCGCRAVVEVPIHFADRTQGESKLNLREQINYLRHLRKLYEFRFPNWNWLLLFGCVGLTGVVVDLSMFQVLLNWLTVPMAAVLAIWIAMTWNYILNRSITFRNTERKPWLKQYAEFCASCLFGGLINWATRSSLCLATAYFATHPLRAALLGVIAGTASNFLLCRFLVFRPTTAGLDTPSVNSVQPTEASTENPQFPKVTEPAQHHHQSTEGELESSRHRQVVHDNPLP